MSPALPSELTRLHQEQRLARDAWVMIWGLRSLHQFLRLPPVATADLEAMSLREAHYGLSAFEAEVGRAVADSGLPREDVFVTTKMLASAAGRERQSLDTSLRELRLDYVDLWLIHWPPAASARCFR